MTKFLNNRYTEIYYRIINFAKQRNTIRSKNDGYQTHHIIPRALGGSNNADNLVVLTYKEHRVCHRLLIHMTLGQFKHKMMYAYKFFNRHYDISKILSLREINPESYEKMVRSRKIKGSYRTGKDNIFSTPEIIDIVKKRMKENNPMKDPKQRNRMQTKNNNPFSRSVTVNGQTFPTLAAAARTYNTTPRILKKNFDVKFEEKDIPQSRNISYKDKFITPFGVFKTKKEIQKILKIPEWTLNTIYNNLDALPTSNGRKSNKIDHLNIDYTKTWRENGFSIL